MKILQITFFLFSLLIIVSCGNSTDNTTTENTEENTEETANTENTTDDNTTSTVENVSEGASKITDAVVDEACNCLNSSKGDDGSPDFAKMKECMGGRNKIEFVADLLGPDASEKERSDAENALDEKMAKKCPMN